MSVISIENTLIKSLFLLFKRAKNVCDKSKKAMKAYNNYL